VSAEVDLSTLRTHVYNNIAETSADSFFTNATVNRMINIGYLRMCRAAQPYEKSVNLSTTGPLTGQDPGSVRFTTNNGAAYTDATANVTDGNAATVMSIGGLDTLANGDWVVVGYANEFDAITLTLTSNVNANVADLTVSFWDGSAWQDFSLTDTDGTSVSSSTITLGQSGTISWTPPEGWATNTIDGYTGYHVRLTVDAALSATVEVSEVTVNRTAIRWVALPTDFLSVKNVRYLTYEVESGTFQEFDLYSDATGTPWLYTVRQDRLYFDPKPDQTGSTVTLFYYAIPAELSADGDTPSAIPSDFHTYLSDYATARLLAIDGLNQQAELFMQLYLDGMRQLKHWVLYERDNFGFQQVRPEW
jgi:hypothetical protein